MTMTLLEKAKQADVKSPFKNKRISKEVVELAVAHACGEVRMVQIEKAMNVKNNGANAVLYRALCQFVSDNEAVVKEILANS